ncbi:hypothetical protein GCM10022247_00290 [Allokutzneria multivorans]|uniref:Protein kinase domain-containing protein n=1 Tax=Allokutzneria multivorans TaxID=1142134 RepID=A0ABP7QRF9_9PSEU
MRSGTVVAGRYRLEQHIGAGGMGTVWRAIDEHHGREVALKQATGDDRSRDLLRREATIVARLDHPNIVSFLGEVHDGDEWWLVMEHMPSGNLSTLIHIEGAMPYERVARLGAQLADALAVVHANDVLHRDIKPSNVLIDSDGTVKLSDFGISRVLGTEATRTQSGLVGGTPAFLAPEIANGEEPTAASDVFSLGATLFTAVEGKPPYGDAENPLALLRRVATAPVPVAANAGPLAPVLAELMRRDPAARPDADRARRLLRLIADGEPAVPKKRHRSLFAGLAVVVAAAVPFLFPDTPLPLGVGDPRTADPCGLVDARVLARFGAATVDPESSGFARCDAFVRGSGNVTVVVQLELSSPLEGTIDEVGSISVARRPVEDGKCSRNVVLPDEHQVYVEARHNGGAMPDLCSIADTAADHAATVAASAQIRRRRTPFAAASLAWVDACELTPADALARVPGVDPAKREVKFGSWWCRWRSTANRMYVDVLFGQSDGPFTEEKDGRHRRTASGHDVYLKAVGDGDDAGCEAKLVHGKTEVVLLSVTGQDEPFERKCAMATALAEAAAPRLPK